MTARLWPLAALVATAVVLGACGSTSSTSGIPKSTAVRIDGPADVAGALTVVSVRCFVPSFDGETIEVEGIAAGNRSLTVVLTISAHAVKVRVSNVPVTGIVNGNVYERDFAGSGVTGFDAYRGVALSTALSAEQPKYATQPGQIGAARSISGGVACGNQKPGSTSITVSGLSSLGAVASGLAEAKVECLTGQGSTSVEVIGLGRVGATRVLIDLFISSDDVIVDLGDSTGRGDSYLDMQTGQTAVVVTSTGAQLATDVSPQGDPTLSLHVSGSATCGSFETTP